MLKMLPTRISSNKGATVLFMESAHQACKELVMPQCQLCTGSALPLRYLRLQYRMNILQPGLKEIVSYVSHKKKTFRS